MLIYIHKERIIEAVAAIHREATEARKNGDYDTFFELSHKALNLVDSWIKNQGKECNDYMKGFEKSLNPKDGKQNEIAFNYLDLAITRVNAGKANNILKVV